MIVDETLVVETKSTPVLHHTAPRQVFNYLRATNLDVGLLLHFGPRPHFYRLICDGRFKPRLWIRFIRHIRVIFSPLV